MSDSIIGICEIELYLPGVASLKEKRGILKSLLAKMRHKFNVAAAEVGHNDIWQSGKIGVVTISNSSVHNQQILQKVLLWLEDNYPDLLITQHHMEIL